MNRRQFLALSTWSAAGVLGTTRSLRAESHGVSLDVWHGLNHRIGHLGDAQDDFNVLGHVGSGDPISQLTCSVNGGSPRKLKFTQYRRLVEDGDFNADIPVTSLATGLNEVVLQATDIQGRVGKANVNIQRYPKGDYPLPAHIRWRSVIDPEDVGQYTDGKWMLTPEGLRTAQIGYDRIFLIGNRRWKDYEVTAQGTIHALSRQNGPQSSTVRHIGLCLRWAGQSTEKNDPNDSPKWGLYPFGGLLFLTVRNGQFPPVPQFYPGHSENAKSFSPKWYTFAPFQIELGRPFWMKGRCETLFDDASGAGVTRYSFKLWNVTRYSFKLWNQVEPEPEDWNIQEVQVSQTALPQGGVALVAHEVDATFGDLTITNISGAGEDGKRDVH
jgi:hypothetical protein